MNSDFKDLLQCLNESNVRYLVIGGYAVSIHAEPRYTKDLDLWVEASKTNASRLIKALDSFGAPTNSIVEADFAKPGTLFIFGIEPNRVDILNQIKGASFAKAYERRIESEVDDLSFHCIALTDLIRVKKLAGRPQDLADIENLNRAKAVIARRAAAKRRKR